MDELVNQVSQRTGISEDQARTAVQTVINFLKDKLPGPIAGHLDSAVGGGGGDINPSEMLGGIGGMFGKKE